MGADLIPSWWQFALLALGVYRLTRLAGWDDFPPVLRLRARLTGERWVYAWNGGLPLRATYTRPLLHKLVTCPFCFGAWLSLAVWLLWLPFPHATVLALTPWALSAAVGLIAKRLDP